MLEQPWLYSFFRGIHVLNSEVRNELFINNDEGRITRARQTGFFILELQKRFESGGISEVKSILQIPVMEELNDETYTKTVNNLKSGIMNIGFEKVDEYLENLEPVYNQLREELNSYYRDSPLVRELGIRKPPLREREF